MLRTTILLLFLTSAAAWIGGIWAATHPNIVGKGQDAAGKGMAAGCLGILGGAAGTLAALAAAVLAWIGWNSLDPFTRVAGLVPATVIAAGFLVAWAFSQKSRARRERETRARERREEAIIILCDQEPQLTQLFQAFQGVQSARWQQLFQGPEALRWQFGNYVYRAALICLWITPEVAKDPELETLLLMFERETPTGHILLYGPDPAPLDPVATRLRKARWPTEILLANAPAWIETLWLRKALDLAGPQPERET